MNIQRLFRLFGTALIVAVVGTLMMGPGALGALSMDGGYTRLSGEGSSWAGYAVLDWQTAVKAQGVIVDYNPNGSSSGRRDFATGLTDYAVSEIPYTGDTSDPQDTAKPNFGYAMLPVVAGGTSFMYNLPVNGNRFQNLKLSQLALAKIFSGQVTQWNDPVIAATNKGVNLPAQRITVVVRSDGSGATAEFTLWMKHQFPSQYAALCAKAGCNPNSATSYFPTQNMSNFTAQSGSNGVTTYTANTPYTINYDEYSYAQGVSFPVAQIENAAGYFTVPSADAVAVALTQAKINQDKHSLNYLSQDLTNVYGYRDPRTYPVSAYSYMVEPTVTHGNFDTHKGGTLAYFETYALCEGQRTMGESGYSPLPMNLVLDAMDQVKRVPGIDASTKKTISDTENGVKAGSSNPCNNPTFKPGDNPAHNLLTDTAPFPIGCNAACIKPWAGASGGVAGTTTNGAGTGAGNTTSGPGGSSTTSGATTPGGKVPAVSHVGTQTCDPVTGICSGGTSSSNTTASGPAVGTPYVLAGKSAWGVAQIAVLLSILCIGLLMFLPPFVSHMLGARGSGPSDSSTPRETGSP